MKENDPLRPLSFWIEILKDDILLSDVDDGTVSALCCHLADLKILERVGEDGWKLMSTAESLLTIQEETAQRLKDICRTEPGFALRYFLKDPPEASSAHDTRDPEPSESGEALEKNPQLLARTTSNLSNLQIVKKYGRQMESFIELEKNYTNKLKGFHTSAQEARKIFNFMLSRMKQKTEPQPWEQLSRRRHK